MRTAIFAFMLAYAAFAAAQAVKEATLYTEKIFCGACAATITKALRGVPGVGKVDVDVRRKEVLVRFDPAKTSVQDLTAATAQKGFPASVVKVTP